MPNPKVRELQELGVNMRILYVEDDEIIRSQTNEFLSKFFGRVELAFDGEEGLEKFRNGTYELVISDISMPKMSGIDMITEIKAIKPDQIIIVTSAYNEPGYLTALIDLGVNRFVMKPFDRNRFVENLYDLSKSFSLKTAVKERDEELDAILDMVGFGIIVMDGGKILRVNRHFRKMLRITDENEKITEITSYLQNRNGCLVATDNVTMVNQLAQGDEDAQKISIFNHIYLVHYKQLPAESRSVLSFTDITAYENQLQEDERTGLANRNLIGEKLHQMIHDGEEFMLYLFGIKNLDAIKHWQGKDAYRNSQRDMAQHLTKYLKETQKPLFVGCFETNQYLFVYEPSEHENVKKAIASIKNVNSIRNDINASAYKSIGLQPKGMALKVQNEDSVDNLTVLIAKAFERLAV